MITSTAFMYMNVHRSLLHKRCVQESWNSSSKRKYSSENSGSNLGNEKAPAVSFMKFNSFLKSTYFHTESERHFPA